MAEYRRILIRALASLHRDHLGPDERMFTARRTRHDRTDSGFGGLAAETGPRRFAETSRARRPTLSNVALASLTCWHRASHIDDCCPRETHLYSLQKTAFISTNILELQRGSDKFAGETQELRLRSGCWLDF